MSSAVGYLGCPDSLEPPMPKILGASPAAWDSRTVAVYEEDWAYEKDLIMWRSAI